MYILTCKKWHFCHFFGLMPIIRTRETDDISMHTATQTCNRNFYVGTVVARLVARITETGFMVAAALLQEFLCISLPSCARTIS